MNCSWCGKAIEGKAFSRSSYGPLTWGNGDVEVELVPGNEAVFCCAGCEWAYELDFHRLLGMNGKEAREHLLKVHEISSGKPGGRQCRESWNRSAEVAKVMLRMWTGKEVSTG